MMIITTAHNKEEVRGGWPPARAVGRADPPPAKPVGGGLRCHGLDFHLNLVRADLETGSTKTLGPSLSANGSLGFRSFGSRTLALLR